MGFAPLPTTLGPAGADTWVRAVDADALSEADANAAYGRKAESEIVTAPWQFLTATFKHRPWVDPTHPDFGAVAGGGAGVDNAPAFLAAVDAARTIGNRLWIPEGEYYYDGNPFVLDWDGCGVEGTERRTILRQQSLTAHGMEFGTAMIRGPRLAGFRLLGPGLTSGATGVGIWAAGDGVKSKLKLSEVDVEEFGSHGVMTRRTDYLIGDQVLVLNCAGDGWNSGLSDYAATWIGSGWGISSGQTAPVGKVAVRINSGGGINLIGCEFGRYEKAFDIEAGSASMTTCRSEDQTLGVGIVRANSALYVRDTTFLGVDGAPLIEVEGLGRLHMWETGGVDMPAGAALVKALATSAKVILEECGAAPAGTSTFQSAAGVNQSEQYINQGGDYTRTVQAPYVLQMAARDVHSASVTIPVGWFPRTVQIVQAVFSVSESVPSSGTDTWAMELHRYSSSGGDMGIIASSSSGGGWNPNRRIGMTLGAATTTTSNEAVVAILTKTGTPVDIKDLNFALAYRPLAG